MVSKVEREQIGDVARSEMATWVMALHVCCVVLCESSRCAWHMFVAAWSHVQTGCARARL